MPSMTILLVEDNRDDEELTLWTLRKAGFSSVAVARDGLEALTMLLGDESHGSQEPSRFDLVILDLRLPKIDGIDVLKRLRNDERTKNVKVIALTSSEDPTDKNICGDLGVIAFLSKPLEGKTLKDIVLGDEERRI